MYKLLSEEEKKEYHKNYSKNWRQTPKGKKMTRISEWKRSGLIVDDYDNIYNIWKNTIYCNKCNVELIEDNKSPNRKCMEHNHKTGEFRGIVCNTCNTNMLDKKKQTNNTSGHKNICYHTKNKKWLYKKKIYGTHYHKSFDNKIDAICYKFYMLLKIKYYNLN